MWKLPLVSALTFLLLWFLSPNRSVPATGPDVIEITYMAPGGPVSGAMEDVLREFEKESRIAHGKDSSKPLYRVVSGQNASRNQTEDPTRFLVSVAGGRPPDVILFDRFAVSEWAARGAFVKLDERIQHDLAAGHPDAIRPESFYSTCWNEATYTDPLTQKSGVYGIPESVDDRALFYNKDLLKRAGYVDEKGEGRPPRTWEELEEMAARLTERDENDHITRLGFAPNYGNSALYIYGWMNAGEFMSADGKRCTLNDPKIVKALEWITRVYDYLGGAESVAAFQSSFQGGELDPFLTGKVAMKIDGFWQIGAYLAPFGTHLNWGVAPPPLPATEIAKGRTTVSWSGGWCYAIPSTSKKQEAAWELIRFLTSRRAQQIRNESQNLTAVAQGRLFVPSQSPQKELNAEQFEKYVYSVPGIDPKVVDGVTVLNELLPVARFRPVSPVGQLLWNEHVSALENAIRHKMSAKEALDYGTMIVQRDLDRVLDPPKGAVVNWNWFFAGYIALLILTGVLVYVWETNFAVRSFFAQKLRIGGSSEQIEGLQSPFFRSQWRGGWIFASPWILGFIVFTGGPLLFSIVVSFCDYDILNPARFIGVSNYKWIFTRDPLFYTAIGNTLFMVIGIPLGMALSLGIAILLHQKVKAIAAWRTFFYIPSIVPAVASSILWIWILNPNSGLLNQVLASVGIHGPNWLQDEDTSKISLILMGLWGAGGGIIIWLAGLKNISETYYEAAALDGASPLSQFFHITLPMLSPYIFFNLIMGLIGTFQIFTQAFIMTQGGPVNSTLFYAYHLFNNAFRYLHMGYAAAMAWVLFLLVVGLTVWQMRLSKRWVHYESE